MDNDTAPVPPVPDQPSAAPAAPARSRWLEGRFGLPVIVGAGGVVAGAVLAFGVSAANSDDTVDASLASQNGQVQQQVPQGQLPQAPGGTGETALTGDVADEVTAAVQAEYPDAQILRLEQEAEGVYEAHIVNDGQVLQVHLDEDYTITDTQQGGGPGMSGPDTSTT